MTRNFSISILFWLIIFAELHAQYVPGIYEGEAYGRKDSRHTGRIKVQVTLSENQIDNIIVTDYDQSIDHKKYGKHVNEAKEKIPGQILETQNIQVDAVSMASASSYAIGLATERAVFNGLTKEFIPGKYTGSSIGWCSKKYSGIIKVELTIAENTIDSINVLRFEQDTLHPKYGAKVLQAKESIPVKIVEEQSIEIDAISGATMSSNAIILAIGDAILKAISKVN